MCGNEATIVLKRFSNDHRAHSFLKCTRQRTVLLRIAEEDWITPRPICYQIILRHSREIIWSQVKHYLRVCVCYFILVAWEKSIRTWGIFINMLLWFSQKALLISVKGILQIYSFPSTLIFSNPRGTSDLQFPKYPLYLQILGVLQV